jgi:tetratricopeptide (TPR) repeat protein
VLDTKGSVVQRTLRAARDRLGGRELDTQPVVRQMLRDIRTCVRTLSHQHQFHEEAFRQGNLNRAIVTLKQALLLSGQDVYVLRHLLDLYVRTGRLDEALALAETHKDREDLMPAKWFWSLGQVYLMRDDPEEAIDQFWQAIRRDPSHPQAYRLMAEAHVARGDLREAEDWLRHAIAREESRSLRGVEQIGRIIDTYLLLGDVLVKQDQLDAAIATYEELLVTHPEEAKDNILVSQRLASTRLLRRRAQT